MHKTVQTLQGPVFVVGRSKECVNLDCSHSGQHYYAGRVLLISLPHSTYGLDVLAFIGWRHEREHQQLVEIQHELNQRGVAVNERNVGKLYRQFLALLGGLTERKRQRLAAVVEQYGGLRCPARRPKETQMKRSLLNEVLNQLPPMNKSPLIGTRLLFGVAFLLP